MNSMILQIAEKYVRTLLLLFAVLALLRGHNLPGGGFIGGLLAGLAIAFRGFAYSLTEVRNKMRWKPERFIGMGLLSLISSFLPAWITGADWMKGLWIAIPLPLAAEIKLGTPFLFDLGVFFVVIGVTLFFLFSLKRTE